MAGLVEEVSILLTVDRDHDAQKAVKHKRQCMTTDTFFLLQKFYELPQDSRHDGI